MEFGRVIGGMGRLSRSAGARPAMESSFLAGVLPAGWAFGRSGAATRVNQAGLIELAAANAPRFDYDPISRAALGLLIEGQGTNEFNFSEDFTQAAWIKSACTATATGLASPFAGRTAGKIAEDAATSAHTINAATATPASSQLYTFSVYVKAAERSFASVQVNTSGATSPAAALIFDTASASFATNFDSGLSPAAAFSIDVGNGWRRVGFSFTSPASCTVVTGYIGPALNSTTRSYAGTPGSGILAFGAQLEKGGFASSYIPTSGAAATRAADVCTLPLGAWWNTARGTLLVDASMREPHAGTPIWPNLLNVDDGTANNTIQAFAQVNDPSIDLGMFSRFGGANQVNTGVGLGLPRGSSHRIAIGWRYTSGTFRASVNGGSVVARPEGSAPAGLTTMRLGSPSQSGTRRILRVAYYADLLPDQTLRAISA